MVHISFQLNLHIFDLLLEIYCFASPSSVEKKKGKRNKKNAWIHFFLSTCLVDLKNLICRVYGSLCRISFRNLYIRPWPSLFERHFIFYSIICLSYVDWILTKVPNKSYHFCLSPIITRSRARMKTLNLTNASGERVENLENKVGQLSQIIA